MIGPYEQHISSKYKSANNPSLRESPVTFYRGGKLWGVELCIWVTVLTSVSWSDGRSFYKRLHTVFHKEVCFFMFWPLVPMELYRISLSLSYRTRFHEHPVTHTHASMKALLISVTANVYMRIWALLRYYPILGSCKHYNQSLGCHKSDEFLKRMTRIQLNKKNLFSVEDGRKLLESKDSKGGPHNLYSRHPSGIHLERLNKTTNELMWLAGSPV